jgi:hypothetical protein
VVRYVPLNRDAYNTLLNLVVNVLFEVLLINLSTKTSSNA